jgi:glucose/arabinose dehydrogenase
VEDHVSLRSLRRTAVLSAVALALLVVAHPALAVDPTVPAVGGGPRLDQPDSPADVGVQAVVAGDPVAAGFSEEVVFSGLDQPTVVEFAPDGRAFVALKDGRILEFGSTADPSGSLYADLRTNVHDYWDRGLLGMALDPSFSTNGRLYVAYTYNAPPGQTAPVWPDGCPNPPGGTGDGCVVTSRLSALTDGGGEQVLVHDWCQQYPSHSMSDIVLDAEGALIVNGGDGAHFNVTDYGQLGGSTNSPTVRNPCGDAPVPAGGAQTVPTAEGGALRAQDLRTTGDPLGLSGSVIRVDPATGLAMSDNPGPGATNTNTKRVIAHGLRNPFRMAIHPVTGELWIGDVGWSTWEEINRHGDPEAQVRNYGWPCFEGVTHEPGAYDTLNLCASLSSFATPYFAYRHSDPVVAGDGCGGVGGGSLSGMAFYAGGAYPDAYDNALFFVDYSRDCMWVLPPGSGGGLNVGARALFATVEDPVHLTVGPGGDLFYVDIGEGDGDGSVRRIRFTVDNEAPDAQLAATPTSGSAPLTVSFDAGDSTDPDGDPLSYTWDFDEDGTGLFDDATGPAPSNPYGTPGTYVARVRVSDPDGAFDIATVTVNVGNEPPTASIAQPASSLTWSVGDEIVFAGSASDPNGSVPVANYTWQLVMAHCPAACHEHVVETWSGVTGGSFDAPDHEYPSHLFLRLHVEDGQGGEDTAELELHPKTVTVTVRSSPAGVELTSGWVTDLAPFSMTAIRGSQLALAAPAGVTVAGFPYTWASWSDGGTRSHTFRAMTSTTVIAAYVGGFTDVPAGHPFHGDVGWLVGRGITGGCDSSPPRYCPGNAVTRGQMASFLVRALGLPPSSVDRFGDDEPSVHENDINALAAAGITGGCGPGRFCPSAPVTRAEMASFLVRAFGLPSSSTDRFSDDEDSIHERDINALATSGVTGGCAPGRYCPTAAVTRAQMAAFLRRALE